MAIIGEDEISCEDIESKSKDRWKEDRLIGVSQINR